MYLEHFYPGEVAHQEREVDMLDRVTVFSENNPILRLFPTLEGRGIIAFS